MAKRAGCTLDQHQRLALDLQTMRESLVEIEIRLRKAYPELAGELANRCWKQIDQLRCHLDNLASRENPDLEESQEIYFRAHGEVRKPGIRKKPPVS